MFITKMHLSRRTVLRGLGATLALPLLDSMVPALTALSKTAAAPVRRLRRVLRAERHVDALLVAEGRRAARRAAADAAVAAGAQGPCPAVRRPRRRSRQPGQGRRRSRAVGRHVPDLRAVQDHRRRRRLRRRCRWIRSPRAELAKETQLASLELGIESNAMLGACDGGSSCAYTNTIAWRTPTTPLPIENDPRAVFERLFGTSGSTDPTARLARIQRDRSILDFVGQRSRQPRAASSARSDKVEARPSTSIRCATSSAASRWPRSRTRASCRSSISRSASRATTPSTPS